MPRLVLASASPRRAELLRSAGLAFDVAASACDESARPDERPVALARRLAAAKAQACTRTDAVVLAADTVVWVGGTRGRPVLRIVRGEASASTERRELEVPRTLRLFRFGDPRAATPERWTAFGKPDDREQAAEFLRALAGREHRVTTAWALAGAVPLEVHAETTRVWFRALAERDVADYLATDEWTDKAGAYGIQGAAAGFVARIEGSYTNVVGLPLAQVLARLRALEVG